MPSNARGDTSEPQSYHTWPQGLSIPGEQGNILQRIYEPIIQISEKFMLLFLEKKNDPIRSQFCTCHDSWAVMTCAKLWPDWITRIRISQRVTSTRFQLWAQKPKWNGSIFPGIRIPIGQPCKCLIFIMESLPWILLWNLSVFSYCDPNSCIHHNLTCFLVYNVYTWIWISMLTNMKGLMKKNMYYHQGWGLVLSEVLESSTSTFKICKFKYKYKYSQYLDGIKYIKYFFNQVQVQVPSTLVTNNSTVSLWVQNSFTTITLVHTVTYNVKNTFQICTKITFIFMKSTMDR